MTRNAFANTLTTVGDCEDLYKYQGCYINLTSLGQRLNNLPLFIPFLSCYIVINWVWLYIGTNWVWLYIGTNWVWLYIGTNWVWLYIGTNWVWLYIGTNWVSVTGKSLVNLHHKLKPVAASDYHFSMLYGNYPLYNVIGCF